MIDLFLSYSHHDVAMRNELEVHLSVLKRNGLVRAWHDRQITAGSDLDREFSEHLEQADVMLLLLSPHFLASDYCYESEAQRALLPTGPFRTAACASGPLTTFYVNGPASVGVPA